MKFSSLVITVVLVSIKVSALAVGARADFDCSQSIIRRNIRFDPNIASRISPHKNSLSIELAEANFYLMHQLFNDIAELPDSARNKCIASAKLVRADLNTFFRSRLELLLSENNVDAFFQEWSNLFAPLSSQKDREELQTQYMTVQLRYLQLIRQQLNTILADSPWNDYQTINSTLEPWNETWAKLLGQDTCAGFIITPDNHPVIRIGMKTHECTPIEQRFFLFHELAHIADAITNPKRTQELDIELAAWTETFNFVDWAKLSGIALPNRFENNRINSKLIGLNRWIKANRLDELHNSSTQ